jgi:hypothetical protein
MVRNTSPSRVSSGLPLLRLRTQPGMGMLPASLTLLLFACGGSSHNDVDSGRDDEMTRDAGSSGGDDSDGGSVEEALGQARRLVLAKLRECGVLSREGAYTGGSDIYYDSRCLGRCLIAERCPDVKATWCGEPMVTESLRRCTAVCGDEPILCQATLRNVARCDDKQDCPDGSDESGCDYFVCKDGQRVNSTARCNGDRQCDDGSDEQDCSFACRDGSMPAGGAVECDGVEHCKDSSDESGCTERGLIFACADGDGFIPKSAVCNARPDCGDGSDEMQGCAKNLCE